MICIYFCRG